MEMGFLCREAGLSLRYKVQSLDVQRELRVAAPLCHKEPVEVVRASYQDGSGPPPIGGFPGTFNQDPENRDYISLLIWGCLWVPQAELNKHF